MFVILCSELQLLFEAAQMDKDDRSETESKPDEEDAVIKARREFVSKFGKTVATVPAVTLLLAAGSKRGSAAGIPVSPID